ncbi:unnamed protein product [Penicillium glandicola]
MLGRPQARSNPGVLCDSIELSEDTDAKKSFSNWIPVEDREYLTWAGVLGSSLDACRMRCKNQKVLETGPQLRNAYFPPSTKPPQNPKPQTMQVSRTVYRAALLHLSVNPFVRASIPAGTTTWTSLNAATQAPNTRLYSILFPQCTTTFKASDCTRQIRTMCDPTSDSAAASSNPTQNENADTQNQETQEQEPKKNLYLPASDPLNPIPNQQGEGGIKLDMSGGGTAVKLDHLGPMVVNVDGTLSQIGNWQQMTEIEKSNTLRVLGKRNQKRLEALRAKEKAEGGSDGA